MSCIRVFPLDHNNFMIMIIFVIMIMIIMSLREPSLKKLRKGKIKKLEKLYIAHSDVSLFLRYYLYSNPSSFLFISGLTFKNK